MNLSNNSIIAKNTLFLYVRMLLTMAISLYTSRLILRILGVEDYGIYNVVAGLAIMFSFITNSLSGASQRYLTFALGKGDEHNLKKVFSTCVQIHFLFAIIIFVISEIIGLWFLYNKLQIPVERMSAAFWVFQCSVFIIIISFISIPYNALIIAHERMNAFAYISIIESVMKLFIVLLLMFINRFDKLILYSVLLAFIQILIRFIYGVFCQRNFPESKFYKCFDKRLFKEICVFSGWTLNGNMAVIANTQGINVLLNIFFGPIVNAARGIAVQVQGVIMGLCSNFQVALNPQITKSYAINDLERMHYLIVLSSKFSFCLLLILIIPVFLKADLLLSLWLGEVPKYTVEYLRIVLLISLVRALAMPINTSVYATGKIKKFQIFEGSLSLLVLPISYALLKFTTMSSIGVFVVYLFVEIGVHYIRLIIVLPMIKMSFSNYSKLVLYPLIKIFIIVPILPIIIEKNLSNNIISCFVVFLSSLLSIVFFVYLIACNADERKYLRNFCYRFLKK